MSKELLGAKKPRPPYALVDMCFKCHCFYDLCTGYGIMETRKRTGQNAGDSSHLTSCLIFSFVGVDGALDTYLIGSWRITPLGSLSLLFYYLFGSIISLASSFLWTRFLDSAFSLLFLCHDSRYHIHACIRAYAGVFESASPPFKGQHGKGWNERLYFGMFISILNISPKIQQYQNRSVSLSLRTFSLEEWDCIEYVGLFISHKCIPWDTYIQATHTFQPAISKPHERSGLCILIWLLGCLLEWRDKTNSTSCLPAAISISMKIYFSGLDNCWNRP